MFNKSLGVIVMLVTGHAEIKMKRGRGAEDWQLPNLLVNYVVDAVVFSISISEKMVKYGCLNSAHFLLKSISEQFK